MSGEQTEVQGVPVRKRRRRRWPWVLLVLAVLSVVGLRAALPLAIERGAAYGSRYWLGLPARIENADFSLRDGIVVLEGITIGADPDAVDPQAAAMEPPAIDVATSLLHLDRLSAKISWQDLREGKVRITDLAIGKPSIRVIRESDGAIDPLRHARPLAPPSAEEPDAGPEAPSEPWPVAVDHFSLDVPNVVIVDPPTGDNLLQFSLEKFSLENVSAVGSQFALGGVGIEGPVLRVRRDLVLASPKAAAPVPAPPSAAPASDAKQGDKAKKDDKKEGAAPDAAKKKAPAAEQKGATDTEVSKGSPPAEKPKDAPAAPAAPKEAPVADASTTTKDVPAPGAAVQVPPDAPPPPAVETKATPAAAPAQPAAGQQPAAPAPATPAPAASAPNKPATPAAQPAGYRIEKIDIAHAKFTWVTDKGPLDVALTLKASDITADEGKRFPLDLDLQIAKGQIGLHGEIGVLPPAYKGKVSWSGLPFPPLLLASLPDLAQWLKSADSTGDLVIDADIAGANGPPTIRMSGRTTIDTLGVSDPSTKEVSIGWKQLEVAMREVVVPLPETGKPARTTVANFDLVRLLEPKIHYTHPSPALNALLGIPPGVVPPPAPKAPAKPEPVAKRPAKPAPPVKSAKPAEAAPPPPVDVGIASLVLEAGDLEIVDTTVRPPVASTVRELFVSAKSVHFPDPEAKTIRIRAILPKASALTLEGDLRKGNNGDFTMSLQKLDLPVFSPYAAAAGATLDAGQASVKTKIKMRGTTMQVDNELVLAKLGVSLQDPASFDRSFGVPIDLALALLRDPKGDIRLTIPVKIDEKGAQVSMGAIIASALKAAMIGAVTSPLKMLGAAFGGGEGEGGAPNLGIAPISATPGLADLASDAGARCDGLAKLLADRPTMVLVLKGRTGTEDRPLVAEQLMVEKLESGGSLPDMDGAGYLAKRRIAQAFLAKGPKAAKKKAPEPLSTEDQALYERYVAGVEIPGARLDDLAKRRAENAKALLVARKVAPERIQVGAREPEGSPAVVLSLSSK